MLIWQTTDFCEHIDFCNQKHKCNSQFWVSGQNICLLLRRSSSNNPANFVVENLLDKNETSEERGLEWPAERFTRFRCLNSYQLSTNILLVHDLKRWGGGLGGVKHKESYPLANKSMSLDSLDVDSKTVLLKFQVQFFRASQDFEKKVH